MLHTLIVSGHTDLHNSVANRRILDTLERELPGAEVLRLDALYTNKPIDVPTEQDRLCRARSRGATLLPSNAAGARGC